MDDLTCTVCSEVYEGGVREPVVLPLCGHTFCRPCLYNLVDVNPSLKCPTCRKKHKGLSVTQLPTNFTVLTLASNQKHKQQKCEMCEFHGDPVRMWCTTCQKALCGQCLFEGHMTDGHSVVKVQVILMERKQLIEDKAKRILRFIEEEKKNLGKEVHSIAHKLAGIYKRSKILTRYAQDTERILKDVRKTVRLKSVIANENKLESLSPLIGIKSIEDEENTGSTKGSKTSPEPSTEQPGIPVGKEMTLTPSPRSRSKKSHVHRSSRKSVVLPLPVSEADNNNTQNSDISNANETSKLLKFQASPADPGSGADEKFLALDESDTEQDDSLRSNREGDTKNEAGSECQMWPLRRCAPGGNKQWPHINWQDFMTQVPAVQLLVPPENPEVMMQLGVRGTILGRIHIRLWGHLRRAQHFLALCLGTFGPSYKGSKFSNVARKGQPGESLVGGRYITENGISAEGLMDALEWRGRYSGAVTEGVLGGASDGDPKLESFFGICTRDYPEGEYYCPFGEVVSGLEVVQKAVCQDPVTDVVITDVTSAFSRFKDK
ncbi:uncharacterized protein [Macrobrachium rosenbergii]|uniref:uncharacterized protein n=1 Tax=Macrobrachium rosenbergii TaxID=79674 RepID=UPI0034D56F3A